MHLGEPYQILSDCPYCNVEGAVIQVMDPWHPASHLGVPVETRCRLCAWQIVATDEPFSPKRPLASGRCPACQKALADDARSGEAPCASCGYRPKTELVRQPATLARREVAADALRAWAKEDGEADLEMFCLSNMGEGPGAVITKLTKGERISTTFDVIAYLFPSMGSGMASSAPIMGHPQLKVVDQAPQLSHTATGPGLVAAGEEGEEEEASQEMDPLSPSRALISIMLSDGRIQEVEKSFVNIFLTREGLPAAPQSEYRVWRPNELGVMPDPDLRERLSEAVIHLMYIDGERDESEWNLARSYMRVWGITEDKVDSWVLRYDRRYSTTWTRLWRSLSRLVRIR